MGADRWSDLDASWARYQDTVVAWLQSVRRPDADPAEVDRLVHVLIDTHNEWNEHLGAAVEATHHH